MVTRKPLPENATVDPSIQPQLRLQDMRQELWTGTDSEAGTDRASVGGNSSKPAEEEEDEDEDEEDKHPNIRGGNSLPEDVPESLRPGNTSRYAELDEDEEDDENVWRQPTPDSDTPPVGSEPVKVLADIPATLRPGGAARMETNPFKRKPTPGSSQEAVNMPPMPADDGDAATPPPLPSLPPVASFSQLSVSESSNNPWQPALDEKRDSSPTPVSAAAIPALAVDVTSDEDSGKDVWVTRTPSALPSRKATPGPLGNNESSLLSLPSEEEEEQERSAAWNDVAAPPPAPPGPTLPPIKDADEEVLEEGSHAWDDVANPAKGKAAAAKPGPVPSIRAEATGEGWSMIDAAIAAPQPPKESAGENVTGVGGVPTTSQGAPGQASSAQTSAVPAPPLPPRDSTEAPRTGTAPTQPPRPADGDKTETYQIKKIRWYDVNSAKNPRLSPILVQNANGPCPLVALVNALTLTTPADMDTALVETLRSREHVSLDLLLNAVFDELTSPRRTSADSELPDITELYAFLKGLHTGMNVNPRFIPTPEIVSAFRRTSLTHLHPTERGDLVPGTFEDTKEMRLYSIFSIPLIHGWIPPRSDPVYDALARRAESYEDVQNLLFREEELEDKLSSPSQEGLTPEEQDIYQDIMTIKSFLDTSATQLTPWGLEVIAKAMKPGSIAILFRNDHFSTLYRHPQTASLLTLVTDAGYAGHEEVVWESLVDVNGELAEFFSGDFRVVGGAAAAAAHYEQESHGSMLDAAVHPPSNWRSVGASTGTDSGSWTTVQGRRNKRHSASQDTSLSPKHEQEDGDLALALQLQEEEDERHRQAEARRRRESQLSEQFIEQQARQGTGPNANGGRGGRSGSVTVSAGSNGRIPVSPRRSSAGISVPVTTSSTSSLASNRGRSAGASRGGRSSTQRVAPQQQTVRPLVPPPDQPLSRPAAATAAGVADDPDDAPPSYEQAAKQSPYNPPAGHPSHPASTPDLLTATSSAASAGAGGSSVASGSAAAGPSQLPPPSLITSAARTNTGGSTGGRLLKPGMPPTGGGTSFGKDRDQCAVM